MWGCPLRQLSWSRHRLSTRSELEKTHRSRSFRTVPGLGKNHTSNCLASPVSFCQSACSIHPEPQVIHLFLSFFYLGVGHSLTQSSPDWP